MELISGFSENLKVWKVWEEKIVKEHARIKKGDKTVKFERTGGENVRFKICPHKQTIFFT